VKRHVARTVFVIVLLATAMAFSGCASSRYRYRYDDNYYNRGSSQQSHAYGYQNGYNDGYRKGQHEGRENDPGDIDVRALEQASHGYRSWMGSIEAFQDGYRDGYRRGFRKGYEATNRRWRDRGYDDDYRY
jgi:flagellar biosynthesis/type III secretory pathway protein FliH